MSPVGLVLDLLLIALLLAALAFGWRLERKLKGLRDSQAGFLKAVQELDGAAARAEAGLSDLRRATAAAQTELTDRLEEARALLKRLDVAATQTSPPAPLELQPAPRERPAPPRRDPDVFEEPADLQAALAELRRRRSAS